MSSAPALDWVIDVDAHVTEPADLWVERVPAKYRDRVPTMQRGDDGRDRWFVGDGAVMLTVGHTATAGWGAPFPAAPPTFEEVPPAAHDPRARLEYMDSIGVWAQVMYPNVGGFGNQAFLALARTRSPARVRARVQRLAHRMVLPRIRRGSSPITATPFWDVDATVAEIERCAALGHRGILFTGEPQQFGLPAARRPLVGPAVAGCVGDRACRSRSTSVAATSRVRSARSASPRTASRPRT